MRYTALQHVICLFFVLYMKQSVGLLDLGTERPFSVGDTDPDFSGPINNVTVALGREAILACPVTELGNYKVGWMKAEDQTILSLHTKVVTHSSRVSVSHDNLRTWQLHIRQVKETDRGCYMCQINTSIMKKQIGCIDVFVPPDIVDMGTSSDITVQEGDNATLVCKARGHPMPRIIWRREDGELLVIKKTAREMVKVDTFNGDTLNLTKLDRRQMGAYLCIASNDVPPAVSKRITLHINFAPLIKVPNQLLGAPLGTDVQLECYVEAYPNTMNYWDFNWGQMILAGSGCLLFPILVHFQFWPGGFNPRWLKMGVHQISTRNMYQNWKNTRHHVIESRNSYKVHMKLMIKSLSISDLGTYTCVSKNSLGKAEGTIRLYEIKLATLPPTTTTESTTTTLPTEEVTTEPIKEVIPTILDPLYVTTVYHYPLANDLSQFNELSGASSRRHVNKADRPRPSTFICWYWVTAVLFCTVLSR